MKLPNKNGYFYVYQITNLLNNKVYIGQTNNPALRWSQHKSSSINNSSNQIITKSILKNGSENFTFDILAVCKTREDVNVIEPFIIKQEKSQDQAIGYNIDAGGDFIVKSPETRKKLSDSLKKFYLENVSKRKGIPLTEEWKKAVSIGSMGKPGTNLGRKFDEEWKVKMSKSNAGRAHLSTRRFSEETEKEICRLYSEEQKSTYFLANVYDCYRPLINDILIRNNVEIRISNKPNNTRNIFTIEQEEEICKLYSDGNATRAGLSRRFNCASTTMRNILIRNKVKL